jgi:hypothetical protein
MKACTKCGEAKPLDEFYVNRRARDGKTSWCKACQKAAVASYYDSTRQREKNRSRVALVREWLWAEKSKPCERCGNTYHPVAMQFDHLPEFEKEFQVAIMSAFKGLDRLRAERAKCQLLCANCHHIVTWERKTGKTVPVE